MVGEVILERLKRGAQIIGRHFREKHLCSYGWSTDGNWCECEKPSKFCFAKIQWIILAGQIRPIEPGPWGLFYTMSGREWDETGLTVQLELESSGMIRIGPKGSMRMSDVAAMAGDQESMKAVASIVKSFHGSRVEKVIGG
jgi:hypothetical protein